MIETFVSTDIAEPRGDEQTEMRPRNPPSIPTSGHTHKCQMTRIIARSFLSTGITAPRGKGNHERRESEEDEAQSSGW